MLRRFTSFVLLAVIGSACGGEAEVADEGTAETATVLTGARVIDGSGSPPVENAVIVIRGDRIESVGPAGSVAVPEGAEVVDLAGKTIMPGIINLHGHLALTSGLANSAKNFTEQNIAEKVRQYARYGVLHLVSQGTDKPLVYDVRARQRAGEFPGARIYTSGRGFGVKGGYPPLQPDATAELDVHRLSTPEEARAAVQELATQRPDFVKLWVDHHFETLPRFAPAIYRAIVDEARKQGLRAGAHIHTLEDAHALVDAGAAGLLHSVRDRPVDAALIEKMKAGQRFSVSTLAREESMFIYAGQRAPYLDDPFFTSQLPASVVETLGSAQFQAQQAANPELPRWRPALRMAQQNLKTLHDAGVKIGFGSDSGPSGRFEGYLEHREMALMAEAGLTPMQIIQIASKNSAEILGIDRDYGTIAPGKVAELLVLGANPLDDISNTRSLEEVWQQGKRAFDWRQR